VPHKAKWEGKKLRLSQKTCQINTNIFQLSGERLEDLRMKGILLFSTFLFPGSSHTKFHE